MVESWGEGLSNPATTNAQNQDNELAHPNIAPCCSTLRGQTSISKAAGCPQHRVTTVYLRGVPVRAQ